jgi:transposase
MLKKEDLFLIRDLSSQNLSISEISRQTGFDRKTVRKYLQLKTLPEPQKRQGRKSKLDPFKSYILIGLTHLRAKSSTIDVAGK